MPNKKIAKDKLIILYIVYKSNMSIHRGQLSNIVLEYELINYFDYIKYVRELIDADFLDVSDDPYIKMTDFSIKTIDFLIASLDTELIDQIDEIFKPLDLNKEKNYYSIERLNDQSFLVSLYIDEDKDENFLISFTTDSMDEAASLTYKWNNNRQVLYEKIKDLIKNS